MTVKDVRNCINMHTKILIYDRNIPDTVYEGEELKMRTVWDDREIAYIRPYNQELHLELEATKPVIELMPGNPEDCPGNGHHPEIEMQCENCDYYLECFSPESIEK